ncbi:MAG: serine/threonine protein kinase [Planctomycetia bacterium]|nr:serine/threonine protein kinase [Planctomycetia bacterium]
MTHPKEEPQETTTKMSVEGTAHQEKPKTMVINDMEVANRPPSTTDVTDDLKQIGPYRIIKVIGFGGVGTVYEAVDHIINRPVALKVLNKKWLQDDIVKERFMREARLCAMIKSPHVPLVHAVGEDKGIPYLAMELLNGFTLDHLLKTNHQFSIMQITRLGREIAKGLSAAHAMKLIHRDIKPSNIWLETLADPTGGDRKMFRVKILDFGMARLQEQTQGLTRHGVIVGTPLYMSPEQATSGKVDARSDLFSLGIVLYRLCTGKLPFPGETVADVISKLATQDAPTVKEVSPHTPTKLSRLIERMMKKDPKDRPPDAMNVARLLEIIEAEEQASPTPAPKPIKEELSSPTVVLPQLVNPLKPWLIASVVLNVVLLMALVFMLGFLLK